MKIAQKRPLESTKHKKGKDSNLGSAKPPESNECRGGGTKMTFIYLKDGMGKNCSKTSIGVHWTKKWRKQWLRFG